MNDPILTQIASDLRDRHGCHTVILYGSRARGDATEASDYDVLGVRVSGEPFRDARLWNGVYLDTFVYAEKDLKEPHDGMLEMRHGKILFQKDDFATRFFAQLEKIHQAGPKKLRTDEIQALRTWHDKALARIRAGGIQGNSRRAELVPALLEHFFTTRGEWFRGPKASFQWLKEFRPDLYDAFDQALAPDATFSVLERLVSLVNAEIDRNAKPAEASEKPQLRLNIDADTELKLIEREHAPEFMALIDRSRPYLREWLAWLDRTTTVSELMGFIDSTLQEFADKKGLALWIWHQKKIVGIIHLVGIDSVNRQAMIGYWVGQEFRGRGLAKKATRAMCNYAFRERGLNRIEIRCATGNTASQAVPTALGFQREGVLRDKEWLYDHFVDHVVFSMLAKDWKG
ncbi:MAG: GNAT family N-acetyltransferase [Bdellovibrionota bacterium]